MVLKSARKSGKKPVGKAKVFDHSPVGYKTPMKDKDDMEFEALIR